MCPNPRVLCGRPSVLCHGSSLANCDCRGLLRFLVLMRVVGVGKHHLDFWCVLHTNWVLGSALTRFSDSFDCAVVKLIGLQNCLAYICYDLEPLTLRLDHGLNEFLTFY
jgi:hypothetical protein